MPDVYSAPRQTIADTNGGHSLGTSAGCANRNHGSRSCAHQEDSVTPRRRQPGVATKYVQPSHRHLNRGNTVRVAVSSDVPTAPSPPRTGNAIAPSQYRRWGPALAAPAAAHSGAAAGSAFPSFGTRGRRASMCAPPQGSSRPSRASVLIAAQPPPAQAPLTLQAQLAARLQVADRPHAHDVVGVARVQRRAVGGPRKRRAEGRQRLAAALLERRHQLGDLQRGMGSAGGE